MENYKAIVHYRFKKGMEQQGLKFLENELLKKAKEMGCHQIEFLQDYRDPTHIIGIGIWNSIEEARDFQAIWEEKEKQLSQYSTSSPHHEFYKIRNHYKEKLKKSA